MKTPLRLAAALLVTSVTLGCDASIPLLPQWTANYAVPFDKLSLGLSAFLSGPDTVVTVPPGTNLPTNSLPVLRQIAGTAKTVLEKIQSLNIQDVLIVIEVRKAASAGFSFADTLVLSSDTALLASSPHRYGFAMAAADTMIADTISLAAATVQLLGSVGQNGGNLATQVVGRASTPPGSSVSVRPHDVVSVSGFLVVAVPMGGTR